MNLDTIFVLARRVGLAKALLRPHTHGLIAERNVIYKKKLYKEVRILKDSNH